MFHLVYLLKSLQPFVVMNSAIAPGSFNNYVGKHEVFVQKKLKLLCYCAFRRSKVSN